MSYKETANCQCGCIRVNLLLPEPLNTFTPRACDCDFCMARSASYLSHPNGHVQVILTMRPNIEQQSSEQAEFLSCSQCGDLMVVSCVIDSERKGAINSIHLKNVKNLKEATRSSPKQLNATDKLARWRQIWMPISIENKTI